MTRKIAFLLTIICILSLFTIFASAEERVDEYISDFESIVPDHVGDLSGSEKIIERFSIKGLLSEILSLITDRKSELFRFFLLLLGSLVLASLSSAVHSSFEKTISSVCLLISSVSIFSFIKEAYLSVSLSLNEISSFFASLTPIAVGMTALGGGVSSASVQASGMYTALSIVGKVGNSILLPVSSFGLAISLLSSLGNASVLSVGKGIKGIFNFLIGIFSAVITAVFSLQSLVSSAADSAAMRAARYTASSLIPVVGSAVSSALSTLATGLSYAKTIVGGGAIAVIISLALGPLLMLLLYRLAFSLAMMVADLTNTDGASSVFKAYRLSLDMIISVYVMSVILYLFEAVLFLKIGVAIL